MLHARGGDGSARWTTDAWRRDAASGGDAGTRRAREGEAKSAIVSAEDGEDGACGAVAVCFDGESVVYVARGVGGRSGGRAETSGAGARDELARRDAGDAVRGRRAQALDARERARRS